MCIVNTMYNARTLHHITQCDALMIASPHWSPKIIKIYVTKRVTVHFHTFVITDYFCLVKHCDIFVQEHDQSVASSSWTWEPTAMCLKLFQCRFSVDVCAICVSHVNFCRQVALADVIIINKLDLVDSDQLQELRTTLWQVCILLIVWSLRYLRQVQLWSKLIFQ